MSLLRTHWRVAAVVGSITLAGMRSVAGTTVPTPIDGTYKLVFDDEFNGTAVAATKWNILSSKTIGGGYASDDFEPGNAREGGGFLTLLCTKLTGAGRPYRAAFIYAKQSFSCGYWEARCRMPANGHGLWPAFWMNNGGTYPEIDIFEWLGNGPTAQWATYHPDNDVALTAGAGLGSTYTGPDFSSAFHVYGLLWQANRITWYLDGVQVFQLTQGQQYNGKTVDITSRAMDPILTGAVGGWNNNAPDSTTVFPAGFVVDYIHIYAHDPNATAVTPDTGYQGPGDAAGSGNSPPVYRAPASTGGPTSP
jgi:beta-glucanase (GH16 family)